MCGAFIFGLHENRNHELFTKKDGSAVMKNNFLIAEELDNLSEQAFSKEIDKMKGEKDSKNRKNPKKTGWSEPRQR